MIRKNYGIKVTQENIYVLVTWADRRNLDLTDISDNMHNNADNGLDTYVVLSREFEPGEQTIDTMNEMEFFGNWKFHNGSFVTVTALDFFKEVKAV